MKLSKADREIVRLKFDGLCAYCGCSLPERWHADHLEAVIRNWGKWVKENGVAERPENHRLENMMPSCPPCNISKAQMSLESWRAWLLGHVNSLNSYNKTYRMAKAYGLVQETGSAVTFHFERVAMKSENITA